jgi:micrococcal nuclease
VHIINTIDKGILGCRLFIDGKDISLEQVKRGMAWKFRDVTVDAEMLRAESNAKRRRLGIWSEPDPDQPVQ